jgi:hypothetical protein
MPGLSFGSFIIGSGEWDAGIGDLMGRTWGGFRIVLADPCFCETHLARLWLA